MKCEIAQQNIALLIYQELPDETRHQLENHLLDCEVCRRELEGVQALHRAMSISAVEEPTPNLLTRARMQLEEALDSMPNRGWMSKGTELLLTFISRLQAAPALASAVLVVGLAAGGFGGYHLGQRGHLDPHTPGTVDPRPPQTSDLSNVATISSIVEQPGSEQVEVKYTRLVPEVITGSRDDINVRQLLMAGARNSPDNDPIRRESINMIAGECQVGHECDDKLRQALLNVLQYDKNPQVRLTALSGLQSYIDLDMRVRDAVLKSITSDRDPTVRMRAINLLAPVEGDSSVRGVLQTAASSDADRGIRTASRHLLSGLPETQ